MRTGAVMMLCAAAAASAWADVITTRDGERIEGLIVETDAESVLVRWGGGRAVITRRVPRRQIKSIQLSPPDVEGLRSLARRSEAQGDNNDAAAVFGIVCGLNPESAEDQLRLAQNLRLTGRVEEGLAAVRLAAKLDGEDPRIHFELGEVRLGLGDSRRAAQHALDGIKRAGSASVDGNWLLGRAFERSGFSEDSIAAYRKVLQAEPTHVRALERVTDLYLSRRATLEAENVARDFVRAAPDVRAGRIVLGITLYRQGRYGEAVDAFRAATSLGGPGYDRARIYLHCARARSAETDPVLGLSEAEHLVARDLDPDLRKDKP